ncbi:hypothetical protein [Streptomyces sp. NPDC002054]|uniref:hypothetical protein n=1 Tax=Streptomyces sp. NPDC002054 TaxID=3154663 RepID=UPI00332159B4
MNEAMWEAVKQAHPIGSQLTGRVQARFPFGVFLGVEGEPQLKVFMDIVSYLPQAASNSVTPLPEVGELVEGVVADFSDRDQQIRIRVGDRLWE